MDASARDDANRPDDDAHGRVDRDRGHADGPAEPGVPLPGSEPASPSSGPRAAGEDREGVELDPAERVAATLVLRRRAPLDTGSLTAPLTRGELAARYGAAPADVDAVVQTMRERGITVTDVDPAARRIRIVGDAARVCRAFGATLRRPASPEDTGDGAAPRGPRMQVGGLSVPRPLAGIVVAVLGLDEREQARAPFHLAPGAEVSSAFTPDQVAGLYGFPVRDDAGEAIAVDGSVAVVELGGGFRTDDLTAYFEGIGLPVPKVSAVPVDGGHNAPGSGSDGADGEVMLDVEVIGACAPGATIAVYFAPNTDAGFVDAVSQAAHASPAPRAISISWGQSEDAWSGQARGALEQAMADAVALGAVVTAAAGDAGSADRADSGVHVDFPASGPHAVACGGTRLTGRDGKIASETVWNDGSRGGATGGGVSDAFGLPSWQRDAGVPPRASGTGASGTASASGTPGGGDSGGSSGGGSGSGSGRGVPDVAGNADPETGYRVRVDGQDTVIGGTSAVAPLWAALATRLAADAGHGIAPLHPLLYRSARAGVAAPGFHDVTEGDNGAYSAGPGWDACTGLGSPDGTALGGVIGGARTPR